MCVCVGVGVGVGVGVCMFKQHVFLLSRTFIIERRNDDCFCCALVREPGLCFCGLFFKYLSFSQATPDNVPLSPHCQIYW